MEKHYCNECLPKVIVGLAEIGVKIERDPEQKTLYDTGTHCDMCQYIRRVNYKVTIG